MDFKIKGGKETVKLTKPELKRLQDALPILQVLRNKASGKIQEYGDGGATGIERLLIALNGQAQHQEQAEAAAAAT